MKFQSACLTLATLFFSFGCKQKSEETPQETMLEIAQAAGMERFDTIKSISYTFNADLGDKKFIRSWTWSPKTDEVVLNGNDETEEVRYRRAEVADDDSGELAKIDQQFINDLYWLIFPLQVAWDSSVSVEALPEDAANVFPDAFAGLRVRYPDGVGYTPGDVYDLFYNEDYQVTHWVFRKGGSAEPTRSSEWKDYKTFGPLNISLNRPAPDNSYRIWFEKVSVELVE